MRASPSPVVYTPTEIRSFLPTGWGILSAGAGAWVAAKGHWTIEVFDGADTSWKVVVSASESAAAGRLEALKAAIDQIWRRSLGRKSVLTG